MRLSLRWKTLSITIFAPLMLGLATIVTVNRNVREHVDSTSIHENLEHSALVFESMLAERAKTLAGAAQVITQDPRFISMLTLGPLQRDSLFIATVRGLAHDFNHITRADLFEILDRDGQLLASVGESSTRREARMPMVHQALQGGQVTGVLVQAHTQYQVTVMPVRADGQIVGALLLGAGIGGQLARTLESEMRSDVTFVSGDQVTGSTLGDPKDRAALLRSVAALDLAPSTNFSRLHALQVRGHSQTYLTLVRRIPHSDPHEAQLYVMQRSYDSETAFLHRMQRDMLVLALFALAIAFLTGLLHSEQLLRPIQKLVRGAQEMKQGNYDHPLDIRTSDELGFLADRFNDMRLRERTYVSSLEEAARLKSEFISIASHELRTPISVIRGYRDLLAEGTLGALAPSQRQALDAIQGCLLQLTRIAENATQVAEMEGERLELETAPHEVEPLIERAVGSAVAAATGRNVRIETRVDSALGLVNVDAERLKQAITNVVTNGVRFTPDGGWVKVRAYPDGNQLAIEVQDSGVGIAEDELGHIFGTGIAIREALNHHSSAGLEFRSAGLGLGLAIARGIVEAHGGTISAQSHPGRGSLFVIRVPLDDGAARREAA